MANMYMTRYCVNTSIEELEVVNFIEKNPQVLKTRRLKTG